MPKSWVFEELKEELVGLPNDDVQETKDPDTLDDELHESTLELNEASNKLDDVLEATSSLSEAYEELQEVEALVESTLPSETTDEPSGESEDSDSADTSGDKQGLDEVTAEALRITLKSVCSKINLDHKKIFYNVSQEDFKGLTPRSRVVKTKIALEGIREFASKVYQAILKFLAKVKEYLVRFLTAAKEYLSKLTSKMRAKIREFMDKIKNKTSFPSYIVLTNYAVPFETKGLSLDDVKNKLSGGNNVVNVFSSKEYMDKLVGLLDLFKEEFISAGEDTLTNEQKLSDMILNYFERFLQSERKLYENYERYMKSEKTEEDKKQLEESAKKLIEENDEFFSVVDKYAEKDDVKVKNERVMKLVTNLLNKAGGENPTLLTNTLSKLIETFMPDSKLNEELSTKHIYDIVKMENKPSEIRKVIRDIDEKINSYGNSISRKLSSEAEDLKSTSEKIRSLFNMYRDEREKREYESQFERFLSELTNKNSKHADKNIGNVVVHLETVMKNVSELSTKFTKGLVDFYRGFSGVLSRILRQLS